MRDLVASLVVLLGVVGLIAWMLGTCEFNPGGPSADRDAAPEVNLSDELDSMVHQLDFPLRHPDPGQGWQATSANTSASGGGGGESIARIGWLSPEDNYVRLAQSTAAAEYVVADESERRPESLEVTDTVDVHGQAWQVYPAYEQEDAWVTTMDGVRVMITGNGTHEEFRAMAEAVEDADAVRT